MKLEVLLNNYLPNQIINQANRATTNCIVFFFSSMNHWINLLTDTFDKDLGHCLNLFYLGLSNVGYNLTVKDNNGLKDHSIFNLQAILTNNKYYWGNLIFNNSSNFWD